MKPELDDTVRMKAVRLPKEAYPDPSERPSYVTVRSKALDDATTVVHREAVSKWLTVQIWGVALFLVGVMFVLFR